MEAHIIKLHARATDDGHLLHYKIGQHLGEGGFGHVFEAWDSRLQRRVALKRLKDVRNAAHARALMREAQLAASLRHPAFVDIFALEDDGENQFIAMELVQGQTLKQVMAHALPEQSAALDMVRQIAEAMCQAHDCGLIHGDLKPSNLMVEGDGSVRILDFGLAAHSDPQGTTSVAQADPQGTIAYMAPERLLGAPLGRQSDIYALGVILYEMLTEDRPFSTLSGLARAAAQLQIASDRWPYPLTLAPALVELVCAMTAKQPESRIASMDEVVARLAALGAAPAAAPAPIGVPPVPVRGRVAWRKWPLRALACVVIAGAGWSLSPFIGDVPALMAPYSDAHDMTAGLAALAAADRLGSLDQAATHFNAVLAHHPNNGAAVGGLAVLYFLRYANDDLDEVWLQKADASAQQAQHLNAQLAISHAATSLVSGAHGKWDQALASSAHALALDPSDTFALMAKLNALLGLHRLPEAKELAQAAIAAHPKESLFLNYLGEIHYRQADYKAAEQAYRRSIALQPDAVQAYANLYAALSWQNRQDEGMAVLQQGLQIRPSSVLYGNLGNASFVRGDYVTAAAAFQRAVSPDAGNPAFYLGWANLADTLLWIPGREGEARTAYQQARVLLAPRLPREKNNVTLISRMGLYCARTGNKAEALAWLQQAAVLAPNNANVHFRAGLAYELLGDRAQALRDIRSAATLGYPIKLIEAEPDLLALRRDANYLKSP